MAAVPQGAFLVKKCKENQKRIPKEEVTFWSGNIELQPLHYNGKLMNSIWGLYNRYSVHNLKGTKDKPQCFDGLGQQIHSVGEVPKGDNLFLNPWDKMLGYQ